MSQKAKLTVYPHYDLGGGYPFGHGRGFRAELWFDGKITAIVRVRSNGEGLVELVEERGTPTGEKVGLSYDRESGRGGYEQDFELPDGFEEEIPDDDPAN